jgi:hypothetical protein
MNRTVNLSLHILIQVPEGLPTARSLSHRVHEGPFYAIEQARHRQLAFSQSTIVKEGVSQ